MFGSLRGYFRNTGARKKSAGMDFLSDPNCYFAAPGCGKTLCAEVFAAELGLPLFVVKLDRLISSYLGETAGNVRKIFEFAKRQPCVLFLDEFDALARSRDDWQSTTSFAAS